MYKQDFELNNPQVLICNKDQPTKQLSYSNNLQLYDIKDSYHIWISF